MADLELATLRRLVAARAVRTFDDRPVPDETVRAIIDVARWTGSARNRQPWRFAVVTDPRTRSALARLGAYAEHLRGAPCVLALLAADDGRRDTGFDVGRVAQSVVMAATAAGLGCCPATLYPDENVERAGRLLGAPAGWQVRWCFSLGYPGQAPRGRSAVPTGRRSVDDLLL
ncbi:nitroreductase family protein [Pseudonocardia sichuanensis]